MKTFITINAKSYYIMTKNDIPYLYIVDTNEEAGFWCIEKGQFQFNDDNSIRV